MAKESAGAVYQTVCYGLPSGMAVVGVWRELSADHIPPPVVCAVPTPTLFIIITTPTPSGTITSTPTPLPMTWPAPNVLEQPRAKLPRMTADPSENLCVTGSSDGDARRACAIRAYNAVWDHLKVLGQPLTWNSFFAITLQGEVGILFQTGLDYEQCGNPVGVIFNGNNGCQPFVANDLLAALDRALIRQIVEVCRQDGVLNCTENEMVTFLGGLPIPATQQKYGIEAWYNAGRTSSTDPSPNLPKLLGTNLTQYQTKVNRLMEWTSASQISEFKLDEGCGSFACSWGNCTNFSLNRTSLYWVIYFGTGDYSVNGRIQFIVGKPIPVNGQEQICR